LHETDGRTQGINIENKPQLLNMVNSFFLIGTKEENGVLTSDCFNELCSNIVTAQEQANEANENLIEDEDTTEETVVEFWDFLDEKWEYLLRSQHFQNAYTAWVMYYYFISSSASSTSSRDGEVRTNRNRSSENPKSTENIEYDDSRELAVTQKNFATGFTSILKREVLEKYPEWYCQESEADKCGCGKIECSDCSGISAKPKRKRPRTVAI
jgi:hypothetical protein